MFLTNQNAKIYCLYIIIQKILPQAESGNCFQVWLSLNLGEEGWGEWRHSENAHASYIGLSFRPPGFSPYRGQEERRVPGLDYGLQIAKWLVALLLG